MFRQFALTIAFSVAISAFNALTLTPALSAILLGHHRERTQGRFFKAFNRVVEAGTNAYTRIVRGVIGWRLAAVAVFLACLGLTYWIYQIVPRGFIPEDDQGYIMMIVQAPQGASLEYTRNLCVEVEKVLAPVPEVDSIFSLTGFSFAGSAPNRGMVFASLKPFRERPGVKHSAETIIQRIRPQMFGIAGGLAVRRAAGETESGKGEDAVHFRDGREHLLYLDAKIASVFQRRP